MPFFKSPFRIGSLSLPNNVFCSALAGCSDLPFRRMTSRYRPGMIFCEMVKMDALIRHDPNTYRILDYDGSMHPIGAQLVGSKSKLAGPCAKIIEELGFDLVDLNCGCPVDKVTKDNSGSGLLRHPELIGEILSNMIAAVKIPVTVKIRAGWDKDSINGPLVTEIAEKAGAKAIFVHGRTREQGYEGPANWDYITECKKAAKAMPVFGNGDVIDHLSAERMFAQTGCDGVLLSRGTFGAPWLVEDIIRHFHGEIVQARTGNEVREVFLEHLDQIVAYQPERKALLDLRRIGSWYLKKGGSGVKKLKEMVAKADNLQEVTATLKGIDWEES
ncbi:MAG: tRNA dihydrouridine synthase DusB [Verrucomicrobia bacterium]|nr:tRNA dihydrouridine synthase DusB [Verrucomicrobiota bacterium]